MSGASRERSSTAASIFLAAAKASALSRMTDSALRPISKAETEAADMDDVMEWSFVVRMDVGQIVRGAMPD